jgi:hypothetical protein
LARETGWVERERVWDGAAWAQTLVFGWMQEPDASLTQLQQTAVLCGVQVSTKSIATRLAQPECASFLHALLQTALNDVVTEVGQVPAAVSSLREIVFQDSTVLSLPLALRTDWAGGGNQHRQRAAMKIDTHYHWTQGRLHLACYPGITNDRALPDPQVEAGALVVQDSGFFSTTRLRRYDQRGVYSLMRVPAHVNLVDASGSGYSLADWLNQQPDVPQLDQWVLLTQQHQSVRLLAYRLPDEVAQQRQTRVTADCQRRHGRPPSAQVLTLCRWLVLATNAPADKVSLQAALVLYRARWQIELLFKLWKQHGQLDEWRTSNPQRIQAEIYAKLLMLLVRHWLLLVGCWQFDDRSLVKALACIHQHLPLLLQALPSPYALHRALETMALGMALCRIHKRRSRPALFQLFAALLDSS